MGPTKREGLMPPLVLPELCPVIDTLCPHASGSAHPHPDPMDGGCVELGVLGALQHPAPIAATVKRSPSPWM